MWNNCGVCVNHVHPVTVLPLCFPCWGSAGGDTHKTSVIVS